MIVDIRICGCGTTYLFKVADLELWTAKKCFDSRYVDIQLRSNISLEKSPINMYQTGRVCTSRPAKKSGRSVKRKKNSNVDVMYIHVSMCVM